MTTPKPPSPPRATEPPADPPVDPVDDEEYSRGVGRTGPRRTRATGRCCAASSTTARTTSSSTPIGKGIDKVIFGVVAVLTIAFVVWGFVGTDSLATASTSALGWVMNATGWAFVLTASIFVVFVLWLAASRFGNIPLGKDGEKPAFKTWSWISMMFAAGMGIGLMFWGVAEPLYHYVNPPPGTVDGQTAEAVQIAMATSLFHWTLHPWAMYAVVGLAMAYGTYRMGRRQLLSDIFTPLFGKKVRQRRRRQDHQHPGDLRHPLRLGRLAGPRRDPDRRRAAGQRRDRSAEPPSSTW